MKNLIKINKLGNTLQKLSAYNGEVNDDVKKEFDDLLKNINEEEISTSLTNITKINPGAISYSLPCEAVLNREIDNEILRLEIENYNKKMISIYEKPANHIVDYLLKNDNTEDN